MPLSLQLSRLGYPREELMAQFLSLIISPSLLAWLAFLWLLGVFLKHCTPFPNWGISIAILLSGALLGSLYGLLHPLYELPAYISQGIVLALFAIGSYDMAHGVFKGIRNQSNENEGVTMKSKIKEFLKQLESVWLSLAVIACTSIVTALASIIIMGWNGIDAVLDTVTIAILIAGFVLIINDIASKLDDQRYKLCWQYWCLVALVLATDIAFACAWRSTTFAQMSILLGLTLAFGIGAVIDYMLSYKSAVRRKKEMLNKALTIYMANHNVPEIASALMLNPDKDEIKKILSDINPRKHEEEE